MWSKIRSRLKRKTNENDFINVTCQNCEAQFDGHFCPQCGQAVRDYDKPLSFIFYNFLGDFFAFDARFFRSFAALIYKPGFLTKEYFDGRRVRYAPPFRIFIFVSFVMFLLLQIYTNRGLTTVLDSDIKDGTLSLDSTSLVLADSIINEVRSELDSSETAAAGKFLDRQGDVIIDSGSGEDLSLKINMETFRDTRDLRQGLNRFATVLEERLETEEDPKERAKLREQVRLCRSPEQAMAKILQYISWAFFLLLPIFALVLKLVYIRRKHNYMRHLVFSIHIHSFIFIVITLITGMYLTFKGNLEVISSLFYLVVIPIYFTLALKKFYGQKTGKVILKFLAISFIYNIIFSSVIVLASLNALSLI